MTDDAKSDEPKTERFNMFMSPSEMQAIDEWAWQNRIRSKSEAVRRLVQIGLSFDHENRQAKTLGRTTLRFLMDAVRTLIEQSKEMEGEQREKLEANTQRVMDVVFALLGQYKDAVATDVTASHMVKDGDVEHLMDEVAAIVRQMKKGEGE